jgi:hypothetical protein
LLGATGALPVWAGLAHHAALPPLDLTADVRVLLAEAPSYPSFVLGLVAALAVRAAVLAAVLRALDRDGVAWALRFYAVALGPALAAGVLGYAGVAALYSPFLWAGVVVSIAALVALGTRPWRRLGGSVPWRRRLAGYLVALLAISLVAALGGPVAQTLCVWASAGLTALVVSWPQPGRALTGPLPRPLRRGAATVAVLALGIAVPDARGPSVAPAATADAAPRGTLLLVPGIGGASGTSTMFELDPTALGYDCDRTAYFSYAGPGDGAPRRQSRCPIRTGAPYRSADTRRPLGELAATFRDQLADLDPPVVVVAHSQGGWLAAAGLDRRPPPAVEAVVLLGAFPGHRHGYQLDGTGAGLVGTDTLEGLMAVLRAAGATTFEPRAPLTRRVIGRTDGVRDLVLDAFPPGLPIATVTSTFDLPTMPEGWQQAGTTDLCPLAVHHGDLPTSSRVHDQVRRFLTGRPEPACPAWRRWPAQAVTAFGAPPP